MNGDESHVYDILREYSKNGEWKFFEVVDKDSGKQKPQSKIYPDLGYWVSYPDFEFYSEKKLLLLVEVKGYYGFFGNTKNCVAMKLRNFNSYRKVRLYENVPLRICFIIKKGRKRLMFWESIDIVENFPNYIETVKYKEKDFETGELIDRVDDFIFWDSSLFRTDEENLPLR